MGGFSSISHWVIVLIIVVLLFGAKKIPELAKGLGSGIKNFKDAMNDEDKTKINTTTTDNSSVGQNNNTTTKV
jgi:sec-independent protein translocase protein TatA